MGKFSVLLALSLFILSASCAITWTATPFNPPAFPLAVRTPYLSTWLPQGSGTALNSAWPRFWTGKITGWAGFIKVDGIAYNFLGAPALPATFRQAVQESSEFTSSQSIFVLSAGPVNVTANFLSPVEPGDLVKQSMPFSYLSLSIASTDGGSHSVQVYTDITGEWVGNNTSNVTWSTEIGDPSVITHQVQLLNQSTFSEVADQAQYGSVFYSSSNSTGTTYQTGEDTIVRAQFINDGVLLNTQDTSFRAVEDKWPVFAFAHDFGAISPSSSGDPVVFAIGHSRDPAVQYIVAGGATQNRSLYYINQFSSPLDAISSFIGDYSSALARANALDSQVNEEASVISSEYASLVALSIRQTLAATEITLSKKRHGSLNTNDVLVFMKEISSDGNVNTVDVIYPSWPAFLYLDPALGKYLLTGLFRYQATGQYPNQYSVHDLGSSYPKALGHNDGQDEAMPIEECGNMIIMTLSYTQKTNDTTLITQYSGLLDQWTQFLIADALIPSNQLSTDDFAGPLANQTNLAIKGIIGIKAMSEIWKLLGDNTKSANYSTIAASYVDQWQKLAVPPDGSHLTLSYGNSSSWGLTYNIMADKLLQTNIVPSSVYDMQTAWYQTTANQFGVPLDTRHSYTISAWEIWTAGIVTDIATRDLLVGSVSKWAASGISDTPLGDWYETTSGVVEPFKARPVVGGHLALLVLNGSTASISSSSSSPSTSTHHSSARKPFNGVTFLRLLVSTLCLQLLR